MHTSRFKTCFALSFGLIATLAGCGGGGGGAGKDAAATGGSAAVGTGGDAPAGSGGASTSTGGTGGAGLATGGMTGSAGAMGIAPAPAGEHFCECDLTEAGAWNFGRQKNCRVSWGKNAALTETEKKALDYGCEAPYCKVATSCPRSAPDVVGMCAGVDSPVLTTRTYNFIEKATITPDATAFALNALAICGSPPYDLTGKPVMTRCSGTLKATVDGTAVDFSTNVLCWFKSDGTKAEYFISGQDATKSKSINLNILQEGTTYSVPGNAIAPGFGYLENNTAFAFPKDATNISVTVAKFAAAGAGLQATFSPGELYTQPSGKGTGPRTFTDGMVDVTVLP